MTLNIKHNLFELPIFTMRDILDYLCNSSTNGFVDHKQGLIFFKKKREILPMLSRPLYQKLFPQISSALKARTSAIATTSSPSFHTSSLLSRKPSQPELLKHAVARIQEVKEKSKLGGGQHRIEKQHEKGKLTARERIELLVDEGSFREYDVFVTHRCTDFDMEKQKVWSCSFSKNVL